MMSVHDALEAWQVGEITAARAMALTGASDAMDLYAFAAQSGVDIRPGLLPREEESASAATQLIARLFEEADPCAPARAAAE
jgi:hypothetical protein